MSLVDDITNDAKTAKKERTKADNAAAKALKGKTDAQAAKKRDVPPRTETVFCRFEGEGKQGEEGKETGRLAGREG